MFMDDGFRISTWALDKINKNLDGQVYRIRTKQDFHAKGYSWTCFNWGREQKKKKKNFLQPV